MHKPSALILRVILAALVIVYRLALYLQWQSPKLSLEAEQYGEIVAASMSGLSIRYGLQKLCFILVNIIGIFGIILMLFRNRMGLFLLLACAPLLIVVVILGSPSAAYPQIEQMITFLLWCLTSAIWACAVTYALTGAGDLFLSEEKGSK